MADKTVLITCVGGYYAYDTVRALRMDEELQLRVVGVDATPDVVNRHFVDAFHPVPMASEDPPGFVEAMLDICRRESVDVLIPGADEEALALAPVKDRFLEEGTTCAVQDAGTLELMGDKFGLFEDLSQRGIPLPEYDSVSTASDLAQAAERLGYPERKVILKPGRGARGLVLVDAGESEYSHSSEARGYDVGSVDIVAEQLAGRGNDLGMMAMEYLPGDIFDVDCVADAGDTICMVPRRRLADTPWSRGVEGHRIERHQEMERITGEIAKALSLSFAFDCDFGTTASGEPGLLEVNPRWSGSVAAGLAAGVNVPVILVRTILGLPLPEIDVRPGARVVPVTRMGFPDANNGEE